MEKNKLSKGKIALIIIVAILYTAVVSLVSSVITKNIIEYKENKIAQERIAEEKKKQEEQTTGSNKVEVVLNGDDKETSADKESNGLFNKDSDIAFNQPITVGDVMEITFTSWEWADEIYPSDVSGYYNYYSDKAGEKYVVLKGTIKNISPKEFTIAGEVDAAVSINDKYETDVNVVCESSDGTDFIPYENIKSLQTLNFVIYASYADEVYNEYEKVKFDLELFNDSDEIGEDYYGDEKKPVDKYTIVVERPL